MFSTDYAIPPHELAGEAEERGFESLWFPEHTHIPTSRKSPWPGGAELPNGTTTPTTCSSRWAPPRPSPRRSSSAPASAWSSQRDPIQLAKEVATLDQLSSGRLLFGIGGGWNAEEMADHGTAFATRWKLMRERIEAMKEIWTN